MAGERVFVALIVAAVGVEGGSSLLVKNVKQRFERDEPALSEKCCGACRGVILIREGEEVGQAVEFVFAFKYDTWFVHRVYEVFLAGVDWW